MVESISPVSVGEVKNQGKKTTAIIKGEFGGHVYSLQKTFSKPMKTEDVQAAVTNNATILKEFQKALENKLEEKNVLYKESDITHDLDAVIKALNNVPKENQGPFSLKKSLRNLANKILLRIHPPAAPVLVGVEDIPTPPEVLAKYQSLVKSANNNTYYPNTIRELLATIPINYITANNLNASLDSIDPTKRKSCLSNIGTSLNERQPQGYILVAINEEKYWKWSQVLHEIQNQK